MDYKGRGQGEARSSGGSAFLVERDRIQVMLRAASADELTKREKLRFDLVLEVSFKRGCRDPIFNDLRGWKGGFRPVTQEDKATGGASHYQDSNAYEKLPLPTRDYCEQVRRDALRAAEHVFHAYRWRCGAFGPAGWMQHSETEWSEGGTRWTRLPEKTFPLELSNERKLVFSSSAQAAVRELLTQDRSEPIGHELVREARALRKTNPRAAFMVAVAGLEVCTKDCVSRIDPSQRERLENEQAPPVETLIRETIPTLSKSPPVKIDEDLFVELKKIVFARNQLVHAGKPVDPEFVKRSIDNIETLIWSLDYYAGMTWALPYTEQIAEDVEEQHWARRYVKVDSGEPG